MKEIYIADLARFDENQIAESHYLVLTKQQRTTRTAKPYISLILGDNTGQIEARIWDPTDQRIAVDFSKGDVVKVRAAASRFDGVLQLKIERLLFTTSMSCGPSLSRRLPALPMPICSAWFRRCWPIRRCAMRFVRLRRPSSCITLSLEGCWSMWSA
jgi:hypothetical protein